MNGMPQFETGDVVTGVRYRVSERDIARHLR